MIRHCLTIISPMLFILLFFSGCSAQNELSLKEIEIQNKANFKVSELLFDNDLNTVSSYNIRKNGTVVIKFGESVSRKDYTNIVKLLRASNEIKSVYAEQGSVSVCPLP